LKRLDEIPLPRPEAGFEHHAIGIGVHGFSNHGLGFAHQHNQALAGGGNGMHTLDQVDAIARFKIGAADQSIRIEALHQGKAFVFGGGCSQHHRPDRFGKAQANQGHAITHAGHNPPLLKQNPRLINRSFDCARLQAQLNNERSMVILS
jgi:hypothetical protein